MNEDEIFVGLATIVVFGVGAQWIGRRLEIPSILLLLPAGLLAGPVLGLVEPTELFGDLLFPLVSLAVSLLLFQSGLSLRVADLEAGARSPVIRLITFGVLVTFAGGWATVVLVFDEPPEVAVLLGAILVVSGPTVIGPLLRIIRSRDPARSILQWEGTFLDPIGATLGIVLLNLVLAEDVHPLANVATTLGVGIVVGILTAGLLVLVLGRFLVTDEMEPSVALLFAVVAFTACQLVRPESGLIATTVLGLVVANQPFVPTRRIAGFGENLEVLIIGGLFVVLGALVELSSLERVAGRTVVLVAVLVLLVRPAAVAAASIGSRLTWQQRGFIAWVDPRGVVAAATAAQFAIELSDGGVDSDGMVAITFGVIIGTGVVYGLSAPRAARRLGQALPPPRGVALIGSEAWLVELGRALSERGVSVLLIAAGDLLQEEEETAYPVIAGAPRVDVLREAFADAAIAKAVVATRDPVFAEMIVAACIEELGRKAVFHVISTGRDGEEGEALPRTWGRQPFGSAPTLEELDRRFNEGSRIVAAEAGAGDQNGPADGEPPAGLVLAHIRADGSVNLVPERDEPAPGEVTLRLVPPS